MSLREKLELKLTARNDTRGAFASLRRELSGLRSSLSSLRGVLAGAFAVAGIASFAAAMKGVTNAMSEFDAIAKRARTFGLSSDFYQALTVAADEAGISQATLNASLTAFVKRVGEARAGTGPMAATLKKLDEELYRAIRSSRSQEEALRILAQRMRDMPSATDRAAVASAAFSRAGVEMVRILRQGADVFDATMQRAREMGLIIEADLLTSAEQLTNDYGLATRVLDLQFKRILVELAPILVEVTRNVAAFASGIRRLFAADAELSIGALTKRADELNGRIEALQGAIDKGEKSHWLDALTGRGTYAERLAKYREELASVRHEIGQIGRGKSDMLPLPPPSPSRPLSTGGKTHRKSRHQNAMQAEMAAIRERISLLRLEQQVSGRSTEVAERLRIEHQLLAAARRAGVPVTDELRRRISSLAMEYGKEKAQLENLRASHERLKKVEEEGLRRIADRRRQWQQQMRQIGETISGQIASAVEGWITGTTKIKDALRSMAQSLISTAMRTMLNRAVQSLLGGLFSGSGSGGGLASLLGFSSGGAFSAGRLTAFATGGIVSSPTLFPMRSGLGLMGEAGPEAIMPLARGPDGRLGVRAADGASARHVTVTMNITTPDAEGFRRNRGRIAAELARAVADGQRNL